MALEILQKQLNEFHSLFPVVAFYFMQLPYYNEALICEVLFSTREHGNGLTA